MFDLKDASEGTTLKYQEPGISEVTFTKVLLEETSKNNVPYIKLVTEGSDKEIGNSAQMFLSTDVKEGKKMSAWSVTARNIVDILMNAHNCTEDEAKSMIAVNTKDDLVNKLSALLVGKKVRALFKGETSSKGNVFAVLARTESIKVPAGESKLKFNPDRDIKAYAGSAPTELETTEVNGDLPF